MKRKTNTLFTITVKFHKRCKTIITRLLYSSQIGITFSKVYENCNLRYELAQKRIIILRRIHAINYWSVSKTAETDLSRPRPQNSAVLRRPRSRGLHFWWQLKISEILLWDTVSRLRSNALQLTWLTLSFHKIKHRSHNFLFEPLI